MVKMALFGKTTLAILSFLSETPSTTFTEREVAKGCKLSAGAVNAALKVLKSSQLVVSQKRGRASLNRFNGGHPVARELKAFFNVVRLYSLIESLQPLSKQAILFGSYATGTDTEKSDIDLFILTTENQKVLSQLRKAELTLGKRISPVLADAQKFAAMKDTPFYRNILKGKVLWERHEPRI